MFRQEVISLYLFDEYQYLLLVSVCLEVSASHGAADRHGCDIIADRAFV